MRLRRLDVTPSSPDTERLLRDAAHAMSRYSGYQRVLEVMALRLPFGEVPASCSAAIHGPPIGPSAGSCGTAAWRGELVVVSDLATDPLWADSSELTLSHGLAVCWSAPIKDRDGRVLGTFAQYTREPRVLDDARDVASFALRLRAERADLPVRFCSGYTEVFEFDMAQPGAPTAFLAKPFTVQALTETMAELRT